MLHMALPLASRSTAGITRLNQPTWFFCLDDNFENVFTISVKFNLVYGSVLF
jgi:hypothetical protein